MVEFQYADKQGIEEILPYLFDILYSNMSIIAPTGNTYEDDFKEWLSYIIPAIQTESRQIVFMLAGNELIGYFQYDICSDSLIMEEIQIKKDAQGTGLFRLFYSWLTKQLPKNLSQVEAYANKYNYKSQGVLEHLGLNKVGENKSGNSFYYKGDYTILSKKFR